MSNVLISLSSFGSAQVRRHGRLWSAQLAAGCGADGVEVRGELLQGGREEIFRIAAALPTLQRVYSSPEAVWSHDGKLDRVALDRGLAAAQAVAAPRLKMSIGHWRIDDARSMATLRERVADTPAAPLIENDQTDAAGTLEHLTAFFDAALAQGAVLGMAFDIGNWHWTGEGPVQAAAALAPRVRNVHCTGVQRQPQRWIAVPLAESVAPWRAVLRSMPGDQPWAIEYPLVGDDLPAVTRSELARLRNAMEGLA